MSGDLVTFMHARLDETAEAAGRGYLTVPEDPSYEGWDKKAVAGLPPLVARYVLAEVDSKRRIMECHEPWAADNGDMICGRCGREHIDGRPGGHFPCQTLRLLALPHTDHPDYDPSWRP